MSQIKLGDLVRDKVTGFQGIVTCETRFLNGCKRLGVQPRVNKDGKLDDAMSFDEMQLELVNAAVVSDKKSKKGGPILKMPRY